MIRPSSLPMLEAQPCWKHSTLETEEMSMGTVRHAHFKRLLETNGEALEDLPEEQAEAVRWAYDYVRMKTGEGDTLDLEVKGSFVDPNFNDVFGTPDVVSRGMDGRVQVFDLKWRPDNYRAQILAYALMQNRKPDETITGHLLFAHTRTVDSFTFTSKEAWDRVAAIITATEKASPTPGKYCVRCGILHICPAYMERMRTIAEGREDWTLKSYHSSQLENDPVEMGKALTLARLMQKWVDSVEHHARTMALKAGALPAGYVIKTRQGRQMIGDVEAAFSRCGLDQANFLKCCEVKLNSSKLTGRTGLIEAVASQSEISKAAAKKKLLGNLGDAVSRGPSTQSLVSETSTEESSDE